MGLLGQARKDLMQFTSNLNDFAVSVTFFAPNESEATINCLAVKHHLDFDSEGNSVSTKTARISFSEQLLVNADYPVRNTNGEVNLMSHKVTWADSTGVEKTYLIKEWFADEALGFIFCKLKDFKNNG